MLSLELGAAGLPFVVDTVELAPDASRLRVWLLPLDVVTDTAPLDAARPRLRAAVASAIRRRRAPTLVFAVHPEGA